MTPPPWDVCLSDKVGLIDGKTMVFAPPMPKNFQEFVGSYTMVRIAVLEDSLYLSKKQCDENATFIVKAVNNHDLLVQTVKNLVEKNTEETISAAKELLKTLG